MDGTRVQAEGKRRAFEEAAETRRMILHDRMLDGNGDVACTEVKKDST